MNDRFGNALLVPTVGQPVDNRQNPNWRWAESWRAINIWEILRTRDREETYPVDKFLANLNNDRLTLAMWPRQITDLLRGNEYRIVNSHKDWVGRPTTSHLARVQPFNGVRIVDGRGSNIGYYQTGAVGPMCIEAAFILATQLAGINWQALHKRTTGDSIERGIYWDSGSLVNDVATEQIPEERRNSARVLGLVSKLLPQNGKNTPDGSPEAGFNLAVRVTHMFDTEFRAADEHVAVRY